MDVLEEQLQKEKKQLLRVIKKQPHQTQTKWAVELYWFCATGRPDIPKVSKLLKQLILDEVVMQIGHRYLIKP